MKESLPHLNQNPIQSLVVGGEEEFMSVACRHIESGYFRIKLSFFITKSHWIIGRIESQEIVGTYLTMCLVGLSSTA